MLRQDCSPAVDAQKFWWNHPMACSKARPPAELQSCFRHPPSSRSVASFGVMKLKDWSAVREEGPGSGTLPHWVILQREPELCCGSPEESVGRVGPCPVQHCSEPLAFALEGLWSKRKCLSCFSVCSWRLFGAAQELYVGQDVAIWVKDYMWFCLLKPFRLRVNWLPL